MLLVRRRAAWRRLDAEIGELDRLLVGHARTDARCRRLMTIPGLGAITATALVAAVADGQAFARARDLAAWLAALETRAHRNKVTVALANKLARIAWAVLAKKMDYRVPA